MAKKKDVPRRRTATRDTAAYKDLEAKYKRSLASARQMRENTTGKGAQMEQAAATVAGGVLAGGLSKFGLDNVAGIDGQAVVGGGAFLASIFLLPKGRASRLLTGASMGMMACAAKDLTMDMWT